jgi:hypothetical protein
LNDRIVVLIGIDEAFDFHGGGFANPQSNGALDDIVIRQPKESPDNFVSILTSNWH